MDRIIRSVLLIEVLGLEHGGDESIVLARTSLSVGSTTCIDNFGRPLLRRGRDLHRLLVASFILDGLYLRHATFMHIGEHRGEQAIDSTSNIFVGCST